MSSLDGISRHVLWPLCAQLQTFPALIGSPKSEHSISKVDMAALYGDPDLKALEQSLLSIPTKLAFNLAQGSNRFCASARHPKCQRLQ